MSLIRNLFLVFFIGILCGCSGQSRKINGVSFVGSRDKVEQKNVKPVVNLHANYASVMPFGFLRTPDSPEIIYDTERQWFGETRQGARQYIDVLKKNGIEIMLKPQIWVWRGEFTGYIKMNTEADWQMLEKSYRKFILDYARLAEETNAAIFCVGTELEQFIVNRPEFWSRLIDEVRQVYNGKLTYAANWDEYKRIPFWQQLDFIGVDAYFPVSESRTPTVEETKAGWKPWKLEMQKIANELEKQVLFTEFGYRSVDYAGKEPWKSDRSLTQVNLEAQTHTTLALFEEVWNEDWFAGGFIWKWFIHYEDSGGPQNTRFTPQNKPVEAVIRQHYANNN